MKIIPKLWVNVAFFKIKTQKIRVFNVKKQTKNI